MLNISPFSVKTKIDGEKYSSFSLFQNEKPGRLLSRLLIIAFFLAVGFSFLPWTQNIRADGQVTALYPQQRPQDLNALIDGRVQEWYVREGQFVEKGDTILFISEIKTEYFDPRLIERTEDQIGNKRDALTFYQEKNNALAIQIEAIEENRKLKLEQARNYIQQANLQIQADSIDYEAAQKNHEIALYQLERQKELYEEGLKSLTDLEKREVKEQEARAKMISAEAKLLSSKNKLLNAQIDLNSIFNEQTDKLQKARSEQFSTLTALNDARATIVKMENQLSNYQVRAGFYYVTAPQSGYITEAVTTGIGENIKAGDPLVTIMPDKTEYAVELFIPPRDLPLINVGNKVRLIFDGWPSIVFSGWPIVTYGTFGGEVVAVDRFIHKSGKYRILIAPDPNEPQWPDAIRVGSGTNGLALLEDVPIWYEIWRQINGFPPNYYVPDYESGGKTAKK